MRTTCSRGHRMTPENTYIHPTHGRRQCQKCKNAPPAERARRAGRHPRETLNSVPNAPLRERFLTMRDRGEISATDLAARVGWYSQGSQGGGRSGKRTRPDSVRVLRTLGVSENGGVRETIAYEIAAEISGALGMDPHEAGV